MRLIDADSLWNKCNDTPWYKNADRDEVALPLIDDAPTDGAFEINGNGINATFHENCYGNDCEVIGNIHDNPELL